MYISVLLQSTSTFVAAGKLAYVYPLMTFYIYIYDLNRDVVMW